MQLAAFLPIILFWKSGYFINRFLAEFDFVICKAESVEYFN